MTPFESKMAEEERRFKLIVLNEQQILNMFNIHKIVCTRGLQYINVITFDFPEDYEVRNVNYDMQYQGYIVCIRHISFPKTDHDLRLEVERGKEIIVLLSTLLESK